MPSTFHTSPLPSLHDSTLLTIRLYHPHPHPHPTNSTPKSPTKAAVLSHAYAPLGGSYDDPVILSLVDTLLEEGSVVCTFGFRFVQLL